MSIFFPFRNGQPSLFSCHTPQKYHFLNVEKGGIFFRLLLYFSLHLFLPLFVLVAKGRILRESKLFSLPASQSRGFLLLHRADEVGNPLLSMAPSSFLTEYFSFFLPSVSFFASGVQPVFPSPEKK